MFKLFFVPLFLSASSFVGPIFEKLKPIDVIESETGISGVNCIYVINLDIRPLRWERIQNIFQEQGLNPTRFSAVNGYALSKKTILEVTEQNPKNLKCGEVGVFLSHISVLQDAWDRGFETIWICEDDVHFAEGKDAVVELLDQVNKADPEWDVLFTDYNHRSPEGNFIFHDILNLRPGQQLDQRQFRKKPIGGYLEKIGRRFGAYSYLVSRRGIEKYLQYYQNLYIYSPYDHDMHYVNGLRQYGPRKDIVTVVLSFDSDTQGS